MKNFERIVTRLGDTVLSASRCSPDISSDNPIEFLDGQTRLKTGVIYLGTQEQALETVKSAMVEPCAYLFACGASQPQLARIPKAANCTYVETTAPLGRVYNLLRDQLSHAAGDLPPDFSSVEDREERLSWLWGYLLSQKFLPSAQVRSLLNQATPEMPLGAGTFARVVLVDYGEGEDVKEVRAALEPALQTFFPRAHLIPYEQRLVLLVYEDSRCVNPPVDRPALNALLEPFGAHMAISYSTRDLGMLRTLYLIVDRTLYMAPRLDVEPGERVYFHDRYATYYALDLCNQRFIQIHGHSDTVYLIHPSVIQLTRYDAQHGTHLRDVLYRYLLNHGNLIRTANATYMHRNTVINKLKKINELVPLDLEDGNLCQRLLFSCQAINYYERVLGLQLKL